MELTIIGCSGSFPGPESPASCYLLTAEHAGRTWRLLLDLGNGALGALQRHIRLDEIDAVAFSHLHPDHFSDICGLHVAAKWHPGGSGPGLIPIFGPEETARRAAEVYGIDPDPGMSEEFDFRHWADGQPHTVGPFTITPYAVWHPTPEAYALRVQAVDESGEVRTLTYSGDTDACEGLTEAARGADIFLCEAAYQDGRDEELRGIHLTGARVNSTAADAEAKRLFLTHIPVWTDPDKVFEAAAAHYSGETAVVAPGASYRI
ncbi:MBL fold metallo-hydrolase [Nesterenkonia pannonica]|uniref:MBL fold metallo-hydrolase n=1 Tax=Nesterenkonia pannonica TaxID=1548602 RepID=UPI00216439FE|nr:MBL fold metallo-hydrolase [Nesterenkonia pannonica]